MDTGEVMIAQFTEHTSAIKIRGHAKIYTAVGEVESESKKDHDKCLATNTYIMIIIESLYKSVSFTNYFMV